VKYFYGECQAWLRLIPSAGGSFKSLVIKPISSCLNSLSAHNDGRPEGGATFWSTSAQELHMIADESRGLSLELLLTKLLLCKHAEEMQIIGMSATMGGDFFDRPLN